MNLRSDLAVTVIASAAIALAAVVIDSAVRRDGLELPRCVIPALAGKVVHGEPWKEALSAVSLACGTDERTAAALWEVHLEAERAEGFVPIRVEQAPCAYGGMICP